MTAILVLEPSPPTVSQSVNYGAEPRRSTALRLLLPPAERVRRWGTSSVSPFTLGADREVHDLPGGGLVGYVPRGRWAVMASDPIAPPGREGEALDDMLALTTEFGLRPMLVAAANADPYLDRGMWASPIADDALIDLASFSLSGKRMANVRHSVSAAKRGGLSVADWSPAMRDDAAAVSTQWLATKRGGEMGFTLGQFDADEMSAVDCRVALDDGGRVVGLVTWHSYDNGRARVLDLMRRAPDAPNPTMDLLIAQSLLDFAAAGVGTASLGSVPRSHGRLAERVYPTRSLHRYKDKFAPRWEVRQVVVPGRCHLPSAMLAVARAYSPDGLWAACRRNR